MVTTIIVWMRIKVRRLARISRILGTLFLNNHSDVEAGATVILFRAINTKS